MLFTHDSTEAQAHAEVKAGGHSAKLSHELIAAAASYEAAKAYEDHVRKHGRPVEHEKAVELLAAFTGGFIDRMVETKGLDLVEGQHVKHEAHQRAKAALAQSGEY